MLAKSLVIIGLATIGSSFTLPGGLSNGFYQVYYDKAGKEIHELVTADVFNTTSHLELSEHESSRSTRRALTKRLGFGETWCGCGYTMNHGDTDVANAGLAKQAASYPLVNHGLAFYTIHNTAVAFVCNKDSKSANIPTDVVRLGASDVTSHCGWYIAGTARLQWPQALDYGYMNYRPNLDFCKDAQGSSKSYCPGSAVGKCVQCVTDCDDNCQAGFGLNPLATVFCEDSCRDANGCSGTC